MSDSAKQAVLAVYPRFQVRKNYSPNGSTYRAFDGKSSKAKPISDWVGSRIKAIKQVAVRISKRLPAPPAPQGSGEHKLVAENVELRKQLETVLARESATTTRYDARLAEVEATRDQALTLGAAQILEIQELRQVVKKYRLEHKVVYGCKDGELCGTCASAELLEPKPTQQGDKE